MGRALTQGSDGAHPAPQCLLHRLFARAHVVGAGRGRGERTRGGERSRSARHGCSRRCSRACDWPAGHLAVEAPSCCTRCAVSPARPSCTCLPSPGCVLWVNVFSCAPGSTRDMEMRDASDASAHAARLSSRPPAFLLPSSCLPHSTLTKPRCAPASAPAAHTEHMAKNFLLPCALLLYSTVRTLKRQ